ncbi:MAG TPA: hypothetical protein VL981_11050 [Candidatus Methylacidiphilales bacterium]|nr:hypothetical protein [Candidatus Methylacidiphilales bacterium]
MPPLTIAQILAALVTALQTWSANQQIGATITLARDPYHVLEILAASPQGFRIVVHWAGDKNISEIDALPLAENRLEIILSYNLGLTAQPDLALIQGPQNRPSVLDQVDALRGFVLGIRYPAGQTGTYAVYAGAKSFTTPAGVPLAAYILTFKLKAAINTVFPTPIPTPIV